MIQVFQSSKESDEPGINRDKFDLVEDGYVDVPRVERKVWKEDGGEEGELKVLMCGSLGCGQ